MKLVSLIKPFSLHVTYAILMLVILTEYSFFFFPLSKMSHFARENYMVTELFIYIFSPSYPIRDCLPLVPSLFLHTFAYV